MFSGDCQAGQAIGFDGELYGFVAPTGHILWARESNLSTEFISSLFGDASRLRNLYPPADSKRGGFDLSAAQVGMLAQARAAGWCSPAARAGAYVVRYESGRLRVVLMRRRHAA